jgi:hypothetical protein
MNTKEKLIKELEQTPDTFIEKVFNFLLFTKSRYQEKITQNNRPIWELFEETAENIPDEILQQLPTDGAAQHDHYLYGTPKREE